MGLRGSLSRLKVLSLDIAFAGFSSGLRGSFNQFLLQLHRRAERDRVGRGRLRLCLRRGLLRGHWGLIRGWG